MKLVTFFEKFDELANTPNGVKQLRELVMQLAVEGGLVPHSAAEPAVPYASVEDAKSINVSDVPANWRVVLLADAIKNRSGNSKLIKGKLHEEPAAGRFQGFSASGADVWCDDYEHEGQAIIISAVGARCGKAFKASGKWCAIANTNITRPEPTLFDFDFAYLVLNNEHFWVRGGSAQPFVKFPPSLDRHFALPPLAEQRRIVAKVDELMALCDRLALEQQERETRHAALARASLARFADAPTPANLPFLFHPSYAIPPADLRKSILTLAPRGQLVEQRDSEGVAEQNSEVPFSPEELPYELPNGWVWKRLGNLVEFIGGSQPPKSKFIYAPRDGYTRFIQIRDFKSDANLTFIPTALANRPFKEDDVMIGRYGPPVFQILRGLSGTYNVALMKAEPISKLISKDFLFYLLLEPRIQDRVIAESDRTAGQSGVRKPLLHSFVVAIPPLAEQRRIVAKVEQLMALVDALETQLAASRATAANLLSALVAELTNH